MNSALLVQRIWSLCDTLRHDGVSYGDYLQQLTFLLFLKMLEEDSQGVSHGVELPAELSWSSLLELRGEPLRERYELNLKKLGIRSGTLGAIFDRAQNRIEDPSNLRHLIDLIDAERWGNLDADVKGDMYEGLLQRNAEDVKSGAGQYFTPRPLIQAIVECVRPLPLRSIADPAAGTGGFLLGAHRWMLENYPDMSDRERHFLKYETFSGNEIVSDTHRLALMNMLLHGIGDLDSTPHISRSNALLAPRAEYVDYVFANPPFGRKGPSVAKQKDLRSGSDGDSFLDTGSKQLDFVQLIVGMLKPGGEAAVVVPDNVLFERGMAEKVRRALLEKVDLHTLLRLPTGLFYAGGVQANVLFFKKAATASRESASRSLWVYDFRSGVRFSRVRSPLERHHLDDFVQSYLGDADGARTESGRFRRFSHDDIAARPNANIDLVWPVDHGSREPNDAESLRSDIVAHLRIALEAFESLDLPARF